MQEEQKVKMEILDWSFLLFLCALMIENILVRLFIFVFILFSF